jgi:crotonobetainyl-CoA:carnitine CoA-transferase CaiB-like acyl-CoA transferase
MSANKGPLAGIRVLDLGRHISCPICAQTLGDLGAEVIKLEKAGWGDDTRHSGNFLDDTSMYYFSNNRNKKSITINYRTEEGKKILHDLILKSDVLLENFRPGTMEKMGFGWEKVHEINPAIIMGSISGYGSGSPCQMRPGFDSMIAAQSGIMDINQDENGEPRIAGGIWYLDILSGLWTTIGLLAALHKRESTGIGQLVDVKITGNETFCLTGELV